ncbi:hypothetical protein ABZ318_21355 [Streptomyces sp. NPDC006197]
MHELDDDVIRQHDGATAASTPCDPAPEELDQRFPGLLDMVLS